MIFIYIIGSIIGLTIIVILGINIYSYFKYPPLRKKEEGFKYVYVEDEGSVREVYKDEEDYLNQKFEGADGSRPYIKNKYDQKTPDGKISGYILRRRVPQNIRIINRDRGY